MSLNNRSISREASRDVDVSVIPGFFRSPVHEFKETFGRRPIPPKSPI